SQLQERLEQLKQHLKQSYERELKVKANGKIEHDSCISHCLPYAFGECINSHETRCPDCDQLFDFLDFMYKSVSFDDPEQIKEYKAQLTEYKEQLLYYLSHQI
ncbi:403_t:CDS:1, partial [Gigaspora rosea]